MLASLQANLVTILHSFQQVGKWCNCSKLGRLHFSLGPCDIALVSCFTIKPCSIVITLLVAIQTVTHCSCETVCVQVKSLPPWRPIILGNKKW